MSNISNLLSIFDSGEYSKFLLEYSSIITNDNENDNLITARGIAYLRIGEPENSIINFNKLLEKNPNNKEAIIYKTSAGNVWLQTCLETGNEFLSSGEMQEAYETYSQINLNEFVNLNKNLVFQLCNNLAVCLLNLGRPAEALEAFTSTHIISALEDDTNTTLSIKRRSDTALNKAIILKSLNRLEDALSEFDICLDNQPDNLTAICGKSEILSSIGRYEEAIQIVTDTIDVYPLDNTITDVTKITQIISLWVARGFASIKLNLFTKAINDFDYVISLVSTPPFSTLISPNETSVKEAQRLRNICLGYHADNLLNSGEIQKALDTYNEVVEIMGGIENTSINILFNRAYAHYQLASNSPEHLEEAIQGFQIVVKKDPRHFQGQTGLGQALLNKADAMAAATDEDVSFQQEPIFLAAIDSLKQAHILDPSDTQILYNLALTLLRTNQAEAAASKFRLLLSLTPDSENAAKGLALSEQMLLDNARVEALKKKRAEAAAKAAANNNNNNTAAPAVPAPVTPSTPVTSTPTNSNSTTPAIPSPGPASSLESLKTTPIKSETFSKVESPALSLKSSNTPTSTPPSTQSNALPAPSTSAAASTSSSLSSSEPKSESGIRDLLSTIRSNGTFHPLASLKSPGPYPDGVHPSHRELYLTEDEFISIFSSTKEEFLAFPQWKQVSKKKSASLF